MFAYGVSENHELRLLQLGDEAALFALIDAHRPSLRRWLPWLDATQTPADSRCFIQSTLQQLADNQGFVAAIWWQQQLAGVVGYNRIDWQNRVGHIGYWLGPPYQGRGLMTTSCRVVVDHGFKTLELNRIVIAAATENHRSRLIPQRLGFVHEGTAREAEWLYDRFVDHEIYACLRQDWPGWSAL